MDILVPNSAGSQMPAYMALPKSGRGAGIVVLQEIFGITNGMKAYCDFLADRQFTALCPNLYWNVPEAVDLSEANPEPARAIRMKMDDNQVTDDIAAAMEFLRNHEACTGHVGVVGFCWGGMLAYLTAVRHKPEAAVGYYGTGIEKKLDQAGNLSCPLMLHFGGKDPIVPPESVAQVREGLKNDDRVTVYEYPEAGHAFARRGGKTYHHPSADMADMRTLSFLVDRLVGRR